MAKTEQIVSQIMSKGVLVVDLNANVKDCAMAMVKKGVSSAVVTQASAAIGIVTERDLVSKVLSDAVDPTKVFVKDIMSTPLVTVAQEATLTEASSMMADYKIRRLVVVDAKGGMVGIITTGDVARAMAEKHGYRDATLNALARYSGGFEEGPYR